MGLFVIIFRRRKLLRLITKEDKEMKYRDYKDTALRCTNYEEADQLIKTIADDNTISDRQYYDLRHIAIESAYLS